MRSTRPTHQGSRPRIALALLAASLAAGTLSLTWGQERAGRGGDTWESLDRQIAALTTGPLDWSLRFEVDDAGSLGELLFRCGAARVELRAKEGGTGRAGEVVLRGSLDRIDELEHVPGVRLVAVAGAPVAATPGEPARESRPQAAHPVGDPRSGNDRLEGGDVLELRAEVRELRAEVRELVTLCRGLQESQRALLEALSRPKDPPAPSDGAEDRRDGAR